MMIVSRGIAGVGAGNTSFNHPDSGAINADQLAYQEESTPSAVSRLLKPRTRHLMFVNIEVSSLGWLATLRE